MNIREKTIKELEVLKDKELRLIYRMIKSLQRSKGEKQKKDTSQINYIQVRKALGNIKENMSDVIIEERNERI